MSLAFMPPTIQSSVFTSCPRLYTVCSNDERIKHSLMLTDEYRYKIFKLVEMNPEISQRQLAREMGVSLGKANFCLNALIEKGLLKASNFRNSKNKKAYMYKLTPQGIEEKAAVTMRFLKRKTEEYEVIKAEIEQLRLDIKDDVN